MVFLGEADIMVLGKLIQSHYSLNTEETKMPIFDVSLEPDGVAYQIKYLRPKKGTP